MCFLKERMGIFFGTFNNPVRNLPAFGQIDFPESNMKHHSTKFDYCNNVYISLYAFINTNSIYAFNYPILSRIILNNIDDAIF